MTWGTALVVPALLLGPAGQQQGQRAVAEGINQQQGTEATLPAKLASKLAQAIQAYQAGRLDFALALLQPVFESLTPAQLQAADKQLADQAVGMSLSELLGKARLLLVLNGQGKRLRRPGPKELPVALRAVDRELQRLVEPVQRAVAQPGPVLAASTELEQQLSSIERMLTELEQAERLVGHLALLVRRLRPAQRQSLPDDVQAIAARDYGAQRQKLQELGAGLTDRLTEVALLALNSGVAAVREQGSSFEQRFGAARLAARSLELLHRHWGSYKRKRQATAGRELSQAQRRWQDQEAELQRLARPLLQKVQQYNEATRWWLRGRYGAGPLAGGLLKPVPVGRHLGSGPPGPVPSRRPISSGLQPLPLRVPITRLQTMLLNYPLRMPEQFPKPSDPVTDPGNTMLVRRHLVCWQIETRVDAQVYFPAAYFRMTHPPPRVVSDGKGGYRTITRPVRYVQRYVEVAPDEARLSALVGYLEYRKALEHFEALLRLVTPAERQAVDQMLREDERFAIYSDLSRVYDQLAPDSSLRMAGRAVGAAGAGPGVKGPHERRGLAWVMALARVELGAMRAAQTQETRSKARLTELALQTGRLPASGLSSPFDKWPPTPLERDAFLELLLDGARQHYYELRTKYPLPRSRLEGFSMPLPGQTLRPRVLYLLRQERKLRVAIEMIDALRRYGAGSLTPVQQAELGRWLQELGERYRQLWGFLRPAPRPPLRLPTRPPAKPDQQAQPQP